MPTQAERLRRWFALSIVFILLLIGGLFFYARMRVRQVLKEVPQKLGIDVQQSTEGFTISKSEGGRTIFTIKASKATQYKESGRAALHEVNIVIYGKNSNRFDQIYGADFDYDPGSGDIQANGEVQIDLEGDVAGPQRPDQAPPQEIKNPIHLRTTGLIFNQKTGIAETDKLIDFRTPHGRGSAIGAYFDSKANQLTLKSQVKFKTTGTRPVSFTAARGILNKQPRQGVFEDVDCDNGERQSHAGRVTVNLRDDNSVATTLVAGGLSSVADAQTIRASQAVVETGKDNRLETAVLKGGVEFEQKPGTSPLPQAPGGPSAMHATAGQMTIRFGAENHAEKAKAIENVHLEQRSAKQSGDSTDVFADVIDFTIKEGNFLDRAVTSGTSRIELTSGSPGVLLGPGTGSVANNKNSAKASSTPTKTVITAGKFDARFDEKNRIRWLYGAPRASIVSSTATQPAKISTSRELVATFTNGEISTIDQIGDFHYREGERQARADQARYTAADQLLVLTGSPRFSEQATSSTANRIQVNRATGEAHLEGDVKTSYTELKAQPEGALLATSDPIHVTAPEMSATRDGTAHYFGGSRLWQAANIIQAPIINFDRGKRSMVAYSDERSTADAVHCVFVQKDKNGTSTPVRVTSRRLTYIDSERRAHFDGEVRLSGSEGTLRANHADVLLKPVQTKSPNSSLSMQTTASQVDRVVAEGGVFIQQPQRRGNGEKLVYTADEAKFVLTGSERNPPSIFDAEHGNLRGDSLIFFSRDDRVLVDSKDSSRMVTQTRVKPKK